MKILKKEYTFKISIGKMLIESLIITLFVSIMIYIGRSEGSLTEFSQIINKTSAFNAALWTAPLVLIITITDKLVLAALAYKNRINYDTIFIC